MCANDGSLDFIVHGLFKPAPIFGLRRGITERLRRTFINVRAGVCGVGAARNQPRNHCDFCAIAAQLDDFAFQSWKSCSVGDAVCGNAVMIEPQLGPPALPWHETFIRGVALLGNVENGSGKSFGAHRVENTQELRRIPGPASFHRTVTHITCFP